MKLLFLVLNKTEKLDDILSEFVKNNIKGATIIDSMGMAQLLNAKYDEDELSFLSSLRSFLNPEREKNNIVFTVIEDNMLDIAVKSIENVIGDLCTKDTGVVFSVPVDYVKGII